MRGKHVSVNGIQMAYEQFGRGERPFVIVHGFTGFRDDFCDHVPSLAEIGHTILVDQRGHGESTNTGDAETYTFDQLVLDLHAFLDTMQIERCDLLGHSMGGMIAVRFVLAYPDRVASLVLMDTAARAPDGMERGPLVTGGAIARAKGMAKLAALLRSRAADDPARPAASHRLEAEMGPDDYWERHRRRLVAMDPEAFAALGVELVDQDPLTSRLGEISCPTLIIVGEEDIGFLRPADELERGIPNAGRVTIPDAAHSPQSENPAVWIAAIREHLARVREGGGGK